MNGKSAKEYVEQVIHKIDTGEITNSTYRFHSSRWLRKFVAPAAIGISIGLCGCGMSTPENGATEEVCDDQIDNDGDGQCDCSDSECIDDSNCIPMCPAYGGPYEEENCSDCRDGYDCDGLIDCDDPDCDDDPACM